MALHMQNLVVLPSIHMFMGKTCKLEQQIKTLFSSLNDAVTLHRIHRQHSLENRVKWD